MAFNLAKQYCSTCDLILNYNKTYTTKGNKRDSLPTVNVEESTQYLGIAQLKCCVKTLHMALNIKKKNKENKLMVAYFLLFEVYLRYSRSSWGGFYNKHKHVSATEEGMSFSLLISWFEGTLQPSRWCCVSVWMVYRPGSSWWRETLIGTSWPRGD